MKRSLLIKMASFVMVFTMFGASARSFMALHQPEIPEKLR